MNILIAEDDFVSRMVIQKLASKYGDCHVAVNGREALSAIKASIKTGELYDCLLLDIMMPEMDGHEVLMKVRELEEKAGIVGLAGMKVIIITAMGDYDSIMRGFRGQCDAYIVKPVTAEKLAEALKQTGLPQKAE